MDKLLSIIIPVYNSFDILEKTISVLQTELEDQKYNAEIILINDGSKDNSWLKCRLLNEKYDNIKAINLLTNYGQHTAVFCGIQFSKGDYMITMDDDLQNPPSEIKHLVNKISEGYDLVFGKFPVKKHSSYRRYGTKVIDLLNTKIFNKPPDLILTNFRIFNRSVADRVINYNTNYPYIPGLLLMHSSTTANVETLHASREIGSSNYSMLKIIKLVSRLLFNYSSFPLKVLSIVGILFALLSLVFGTITLITSLRSSSSVPGWASLMIMLSFLNGITIIMLGALGVYVSRTLTQISSSKNYHIKEKLF